MHLKVWLVREHPSRLQTVQLRKFIVLSAVAALAISSLRRQNGYGSERRQRLPQRREVRVENDEYGREQQRLVKQIERVVVLRNDHILAFCAVRNRAHILETLST